MSVSELLKKNRESAGITLEDLAKSLSVPPEILAYIEEPVAGEVKIIELLAQALDMTPEVFKGEVPPEPEEPTEQEIKAAAVQNARFPNIREYLLDSSRCENQDKAIELFGKQELSLTEKNVILYLSTTALYHFCDTNTSGFAFDEYLFKLHGPLLSQFEKELGSLNLSAEEKEGRLGNARSNIFACDSIENIAIRVVEPFAREMEQKLANNIFDFDDDLDMPFTWHIDDVLMKIEIKNQKGEVKDKIKLLDVKERA